MNTKINMRKYMKTLDILSLYMYVVVSMEVELEQKVDLV